MPTASRRDVVRGGVATALVGGFALGLCEALLTLDANTFVQPGQYVYMYLAVPILAWMGLALVLLLPWILVLTLLPHLGTMARALGTYAAVLGFAGVLSMTVPTIWQIVEALQDVGVYVGVPLWLLLYAAAGLLAAVAAVTLGAAGAWYGMRTNRPLRLAMRAVLLAVPFLLWPIGRFVMTDWRWSPVGTSAPSSRAASPNILLISIDTLRADHVGSYGGPEGLTPQLDTLAAEGVVFQEAITSAPWTLPAMASLFTGLHPRHHGAGWITNRWDPLGRSPLPAGTWTLTTALHAAGYRTQAIVTNPYLALQYGFGEGFDGYENLTIVSEFFLAGRHVTAMRLLRWLRPDLIVGDRGTTVSKRAVRWIEEIDGNQPFFLWLHYIDPHPPYSRPGVTQYKSFRSDSLLGASSESPSGPMLSSPDVARLRSGEVRLSEKQKEEVRALYRAEVAAVDAAIGQVLDALAGHGLRTHTLVICVSDHGEEFWEHGGVEHGHTLYDEVLRVPLILSWPGVLPEGVQIANLVRLTDVVPTVLDLLKLSPPHTTRDGQSLLPLIGGEEGGGRIAYSENLLFAEERVSLRTQERKYIQWDLGKEEAYDLRVDPGELRDLAGSPDIVEAMRQALAGLSLVPLRPNVGDQPPPHPVNKAALRALGYLH